MAGVGNNDLIIKNVKKIPSQLNPPVQLSYVWQITLAKQIKSVQISVIRGKNFLPQVKIPFSEIGEICGPFMYEPAISCCFRTQLFEVFEANNLCEANSST